MDSCENNDKQWISFSPKVPCMMIDTSYYIFHRYFATLRWFSFKPEYSGIDGSTLCETPAFMEAYYKHLQQDLVKYKKTFLRFKKHSNSVAIAVNSILFLQDCPRATIWRHRHHATYKEGREVSSKMDTRIFALTYAWLNENGYRLLNIPELEADDLAYLVKCEIRKVNPEQEIVLLTNDNDYIQLCDDRCQCFNASLKNIADRCQFGGSTSPLVEMRAKILLGDKSDCIPACVGKKQLTQLDLLHCPEEVLATRLSATEFSVYEKNRRLIDLSQIPEELQRRFKDTYGFSQTA